MASNEPLPSLAPTVARTPIWPLSVAPVAAGTYYVALRSAFAFGAAQPHLIGGEVRLACTTLRRREGGVRLLSIENRLRLVCI